MAGKSAKKYVALRYMTEFHCIGNECEDNCCGGWRIDIDERHYQRLKREMSRRGESDQFALGFQLKPPGERARHSFAVLQQLEDGTCRFLDGERLCTLHRCYGADFLPDVCDTYPRTVSRAGRRVELTASISCPEVARRALLHEDATDILECTPALVGRLVEMQTVPADTEHAYGAALDDLRGTLYGLLNRRQYPMASRLYFVVTFAARVSEFLNEQTPTVDPVQLENEMHLIETPEVLEDLHNRLRGTDVSSALAAALVSKLLASRMSAQVPAVFRQLVRAALQSFEGAGVRLVPGTDERTVSPDLLWETYAARRETRSRVFGERLDLYFQNYCKNWVMRDWYLFSPSLLLHVQNLLARVALLRFLLLSDPRLEELAAIADQTERQRRCDQLAVEVFYAFSRTIEHSDQFIAGMTEAMRQQFSSMAHSICLLKF